MTIVWLYYSITKSVRKPVSYILALEITMTEQARSVDTSVLFASLTSFSI